MCPRSGAGRLYVQQFVVKADEPLQIPPRSSPDVPARFGGGARVVPLDQFRWITFGHVESDGCGSMNDGWL
jgi:hypothetical protein